VYGSMLELSKDQELGRALLPDLLFGFVRHDIL
jgi:hypothetical protein